MSLDSQVARALLRSSIIDVQCRYLYEMGMKQSCVFRGLRMRALILLPSRLPIQRDALQLDKNVI